MGFVILNDICPWDSFPVCCVRKANIRDIEKQNGLWLSLKLLLKIPMQNTLVVS